MLHQIIIATLIASAFSFIGIFFIYKKVSFKGVQLKWVVSLAAGALLAVSFIDLIPEAIEEYGEPHPIMLTVLIAFLAFFLLERALHWHHCHCDEEHMEKAKVRQSVAITNLFGDAFHNLIDGFLIASAFLIDFQLGVVTTIAVILHEIPQEVSDFGILLHAGYSRKKALMYNFLFALTAVVGGIVFYYLGSSLEGAIPFMGAIAAGTFLYLSAADLIPELHHEKSSRQVVIQTIWLLAGVFIMLIVNNIAHGAEITPEQRAHEEATQQLLQELKNR